VGTAANTKDPISSKRKVSFLFWQFN
jgi:hypothetical protein